MIIVGDCLETLRALEPDGSGSTGVACKRLGFKFIGIELNPEYAAIAEKRIEATA